MFPSFFTWLRLFDLTSLSGEISFPTVQTEGKDDMNKFLSHFSLTQNGVTHKQFLATKFNTRFLSLPPQTLIRFL